uniref:Uncharacterized protein n=1 Tax=Anser brachyrhynchus TaxID=132585 RepID=A0A8B9BHL6_9AVES
MVPKGSSAQATPRRHKASPDAPHLPLPAHSFSKTRGVNRDCCQPSNLQQCNPSPWTRRIPLPPGPKVLASCILSSTANLSP